MKDVAVPMRVFLERTWPVAEDGEHEGEFPYCFVGAEGGRRIKRLTDPEPLPPFPPPAGGRPPTYDHLWVRAIFDMIGAEDALGEVAAAAVLARADDMLVIDGELWGRWFGSEESAEDGFTADPATLRWATVAPEQFWICMRCEAWFENCPDSNAYDCPVCGDKVCPRRLMPPTACSRYVPCNGELTFYRCDGRMICETCGKDYYHHPWCVNSRMPPQMQTSIRPEYILHVLCNGDHIKT